MKKFVIKDSLSSYFVRIDPEDDLPEWTTSKSEAQKFVLTEDDDIVSEFVKVINKLNTMKVAFKVVAFKTKQQKSQRPPVKGTTLLDSEGLPYIVISEECDENGFMEVVDVDGNISQMSMKDFFSDVTNDCYEVLWDPVTGSRSVDTARYVEKHGFDPSTF